MRTYRPIDRSNELTKRGISPSNEYDHSNVSCYNHDGNENRTDAAAGRDREVPNNRLGSSSICNATHTANLVPTTTATANKEPEWMEVAESIASRLQLRNEVPPHSATMITAGPPGVSLPPVVQLRDQRCYNPI